MSAIQRRAQRLMFFVIAGLLGLSLFAPIVALGNGDLVSGDTAIVSTGGGDATLRADASVDAAPIGSIPDGSEVFIIAGPISDADGSLWYQAGIWEITGFISSTVLEGTDTPTTDEPVADETVVDDPSAPVIPWQDPIDFGVVVDNSTAPLPADGLACRGDVAASSDVIIRLSQGQSVEVVGEELWSDGIAFLPVNCGGQGGYVKADYVALDSDAAPAPVADDPAAPVDDEVADAPVVEDEPVADEVVEDPVAEVPTVGDLVVTISDQNGDPVAGACFDLYAVDGWVAHTCDSADAIPNNGNSGFFGIATGSYTVVAVPGEFAIPDLEVWVAAGDTSYTGATVTTAAVEDPAEEVVPEDVTEEVPTEEPAEEVATEEVTEEAATEEATEEAATEEATEEIATEEVTEEVATEAPAEEVATDDATEEAITEEATDEAAAEEATEAPAEDAVSGPDPSQAIGDATVAGTNGEGVRCRVAPDTAAATIIILEEGTRITTRGETSGEWAQVDCAGMDGFVSTMHITVGTASIDPGDDEGPGMGGAASGYVTGTGGASLNCRSAASMSGLVITAIQAGSVVAFRGAASNGWQPVICAGRNGYVSTTFVSAMTDSGDSDPDEDAPGSGLAASDTGTVTNTGNAGLRCRTSAPSGSTITVLPEGTRVTIRGDARNGWAPVVCAGMNGFVSMDYFTVGAPVPDPGDEDGDGSGDGGGASSGYVKVTTGGASLNCRSAASLSGLVITAIQAGSTVEVRGPSANGWQPVTCANRSGYVSTDFVTATPDPGNPEPDPDEEEPDSGQTGTARVANTGGAGLRCRTSAPSGSIITVVAEGASVGTRGAASNGWTPVVCGGRNGVMSSEFLSAGGGSPAPDPDPDNGAVIGNGDHGQVTVRVNMRSQASLGAPVMIVVEPGQVVLITGNVTNGFYPIDYDGLMGFVSANLLFETSAALSERGGSDGGVPGGTGVIFDGQNPRISQPFGRTEFSTGEGAWMYGYAAGLGVPGGHPGIDYAMPSGTPVYIPISGTVVYGGGSGSFRDYRGDGPGRGELRIRADNGHIIILGHMSWIPLVPGQRVTAGQYAGLSGSFNGGHVHLEVRVPGNTSTGWRAVDPGVYFGGTPIT